MYGVAELLQRWRAGIVTSEVLVARPVAVRAPVALECSSGRIDDGHPVVAVPVSDVRLIVRVIDEDFCELMKGPGVIAAGVRVREPELLDELAVLGTLQDFVVVDVIAADPHVTLAVDGDAMVRDRPVVPLTGAPEMTQQVARLIELEDRRRGFAAFALGRVLLRPTLGPIERGAAAVNNPHVVLRIDRHADRRAEQPVVRQWLGPQGIDFKPRSLSGALGLRLDPSLEHALA